MRYSANDHKETTQESPVKEDSGSGNGSVKGSSMIRKGGDSKDLIKMTDGEMSVAALEANQLCGTKPLLFLMPLLSFHLYAKESYQPRA